MGRRPRHYREDAYYFVTNKCHQSRFFLLPVEKVNAIILGMLASTAEKYDVEIVAFVFMSNHFHMILRSRSLHISQFLGDFQSDLATALNAHWGREGSFFRGRFKCSDVLDDDSLLQKLCYTICNPCESNLVTHPRLWPGLSSWDAHANGEPLVGWRVDKKEYWKLRRKHPEMTREEAEERAKEPYVLELARLPIFEDLTDAEYDQKILELVDDHAEMLAEERLGPCVGRDKILKQKWYRQPRRRADKTPCPPCHTTCSKLRQQFLDELYEVADHYQRAMGKWRKGKSNVTFPHGTFPPGHYWCIGATRQRQRWGG